MKKKNAISKSREDWIRAGLQILEERGVDGVKVVHIANRLGVTSGSFYWHFKALPDLLDSILEYWERALTDTIIVEAKMFPGPPKERIFNLMQQVIDKDAAILDQAISVWSRKDPAVHKVYIRTLHKRFEFACWMFERLGFTKRQAKTRGRLMVAYLIGESSGDLKTLRNWKNILREQLELMVTPVE